MNWQKNPLIPAVIQDYLTGDILMLGYQNAEAYQKTLETGEVYFYSRSRQELWHKGATSGNKLFVKSVYIDCDQDTVLIKAEPTGNICHTGARSCFFTEVVEKEPALYNTLAMLQATIQDRQQTMVKGSYTASLFAEGLDRIIQKVGEEAIETVIAAKNDSDERLVSETADLLYHLSVLLTHKGLQWNDIFGELRNRSK